MNARIISQKLYFPMDLGVLCIRYMTPLSLFYLPALSFELKATCWADYAIPRNQSDQCTHIHTCTRLLCVMMIIVNVHGCSSQHDLLTYTEDRIL